MQLGEGFNVTYFWYHHMMPDEDREEIHKALMSRKYDRFHELQEKWNNKYKGIIFLPSTATLWYKENIIGEIYLNSDLGLQLINFEECECG